MLEAVTNARGKIEILAAVLNGTCNFLLDRCASGDSFASAIREAQRLGFAETDPTEDLSGGMLRGRFRSSRVMGFG